MTLSIFHSVSLFGIGILALIWSAHRFVLGASVIALKTGMSQLLVGLTIVAIGTSAPELFISVLASLNQTTDLAIGGSIGSNIANIGLIGGIIICLQPNMLKHTIPTRLMLLFCLTTLLAVAILFRHQLDILSSWLFILLFLVALCLKVYIYLTEKKKPHIEDEPEQATTTLPWAIFWLLVGSIILPLSASLTVEGAKNIALYFGISELTVGLVLVALGTSLPELVTSLVSIMQDKQDLALGNIIGSNLFNITLVLAPIGFIEKALIPDSVLQKDIQWMLLFTIIYIYLLIVKKHKYIRLKGAFLLALYGAFLLS